MSTHILQLHVFLNLSFVEVVRTVRMTRRSVALQSAEQLLAFRTSVHVGRIHLTERTCSEVLGQRLTHLLNPI